MASSAVVASPVGPLRLDADGDRLIGISFGAPATFTGPSLEGVLGETARQLSAYFDHRLETFDLPVAPGGTPFQLRVWSALRTIPYGRTWSYAELARAVGRPTAVRAVGAANGRNPIPIVIPCHRVIGSDGRLVGFGGGLDAKRQLLALEGRPSLLA
jgi:methylated-DNA-[protein]-cysteine S-methyltransferase